MHARRDALHGREQLERAERLADVAVRPRLVREPAALEVGARQEHDRDPRGLGIPLQTAAERQPVDPGHADVEQDRVGAAARQRCQCGLGVLGLVELDVHGVEGRSEQLPDRRIVVDQQKTHGSPFPTVVFRY